MSAPIISLSGAALRENVRSWKRLTRAGVRAVVKADGYGFGLERIVRELDGVADGFVVSDLNEFERLRSLSSAPAATLYDGGPEYVCRVADLGGIVNIARFDSLAALARRSNASEVTARVGLRLAAGWSAIDIDDAKEYAHLLSRSGMRVELWTHLSNPATEAEDRELFARFVALFRENGVEVAGEDVESTFPAARGGVWGGSIRIGVGLFGSGTPGTGNERLTCAIEVRATVLDRIFSDGTLRAGYGPDALPCGSQVSVLRCGYSDGFPRVTRPYRSLLSVGMQYSILRDAVAGDECQLLGPDDDLDELAAAAYVLPHQIVTGLGLASQRQACFAYNSGCDIAR
ncbi:MAG: alanine racemase [Candidatus Eremiobacteraeota bacterium]|nr:alanine racemase [Candidatus Eremiobacteraeota bacterium]